MIEPWVHDVPAQLDGRASIRMDAGLFPIRLPPIVAPWSTRLPPGCTVTLPPTTTLLSVHVAPAGTVTSLPVRLFGNVATPVQLTAAWAAGTAATPKAPTIKHTTDARTSTCFMGPPPMSLHAERNRRSCARRGAICPI